MIKRFLLLLSVIGMVTAQAQSFKQQLKDSTLIFEGIGSVNFSQVALSNWNGGGNNALSVASLLDLRLEKIGENYDINTTLSLAYGLQKIEQLDFRKTDDRIEFISEHTTKAFGNWNYLSNLTFRSQFDKGYNYTSDTTRVLISEFLSPGYFLLSFGLSRSYKKVFTASISPLAGKVTVVTNDSLSALGAFGVDSAKTIRAEFGGKLKFDLNVDLFENVSYTSSLELFSNYIDNPKNIDVNWSNLIAIKANEFLTTTLSFNLIYDDDINIAGPDDNDDGTPDYDGPRTQLKQVFNIGIQYKF